MTDLTAALALLGLFVVLFVVEAWMRKPNKSDYREFSPWSGDMWGAAGTKDTHGVHHHGHHSDHSHHGLGHHGDSGGHHGGGDGGGHSGGGHH